jgi:hypothetical protein
MRVQDWFADHFGTQYAVPQIKAKKKEPSRLLWFVTEFARTVVIVIIGAMAILPIAAKALTPKRGQPPVALLLLAAFFSSVAGMYFVFLI